MLQFTKNNAVGLHVHFYVIVSFTYVSMFITYDSLTKPESLVSSKRCAVISLEKAINAQPSNELIITSNNTAVPVDSTYL